MVTVRPARMGDLGACARVCFEAFSGIAAEHNFPVAMSSVEIVTHVLGSTIQHPGFYTVVAERDGRILGLGRVDERSPIAGVGPLAVEPAAQDAGVGKLLMAHLLHRADARGFPGVRLVQAAYHCRSLALYTRLGFVVREPLVALSGVINPGVAPECAVRPAAPEDIEACGEVCARVHGHDRSGELRDAIERGEARVVARDGQITGYTTEPGFGGHSVGESGADIQALLSAAGEHPAPGFLLPSRSAELFRWCLEQGLRVLHPWTLMTRGLYHTPRGAFLPSILY